MIEHEPTGGEVFSAYFEQRAELACELWTRAFYLDATVIRTTALDSLAATWAFDFPTEARRATRKTDGGNVSHAVRLARFMREFVPDDPHAFRVAVVPFAEDMRRHCPTLVDRANALLAERVPTMPRALPYAHLDHTREALAVEVPECGTIGGVDAVMEEYEYAAMLYRLWRCPLAHHSTWSKSTHGFARGDAVMYMKLQPERTSISFGPDLADRWLRAAARSYGMRCDREGVRPGGRVDASIEGDGKLASAWGRLRSAI